MLYDWLLLARKKGSDLLSLMLRQIDILDHISAKKVKL